MKVLALVDGEHYPPVTRWGIEVARERGIRGRGGAARRRDREARAGDELLDLGYPSSPVGRPMSAALARADRRAPTRGRPRPVRRAGPGLPRADGARRGSARAGVAVPRTRFPIRSADLGAAARGPDGRGHRHGQADRQDGHRGGTRSGRRSDGREPCDRRHGARRSRGAAGGSRRNRGPRSAARAGAPRRTRRFGLPRGCRQLRRDDGRRPARRGRLAGAPMATNVREAANVAVGLGAGVVVLEGSGSSVPPIPWDAGVLVVPVPAPPEYLGGYLGPYRLLLSDLVVFTMADAHTPGREHLRSAIPRPATSR